MADSVQRGDPPHSHLCGPRLVHRPSWPHPFALHRPKRSHSTHGRCLPHHPRLPPPTINGRHAHQHPHQKTHQERIPTPVLPPPQFSTARKSPRSLGPVRTTSDSKMLFLPYFLDMSAYAIQGASFGTSSIFPIIGHDGGPGG
jgi:hypothetical protein